MTVTGWLDVPDELPVSGHLRTVAEILSAPPTAAERRQLRREQAEADELAARARDAADSAAAVAFRRRMNGDPGSNPLAVAAADPFRDTEAADRRRAAIGILRPHGLADVVTGGVSGCVMDPNLGVLESPADESARAELDRQYEFERSARIAEEGRATVNRARAWLDEQWRARGQLPRRESHRSAVPSAEDVYRRACAEIGCPADDGRAQGSRASLGTDYFGRPINRQQWSYR